MKLLIHIVMKALQLVTIGLTFAMVGFGFFAPEIILQFVGWMKGIITFAGYRNYPIAYIAAMIESLPFVGMAIPGQNILLLITGFVGQHSFFWMIGIAALGVFTGDMIGYRAGTRINQTSLLHYGSYFGLGEKEIAYIYRSIHTYGRWAMIIGKFHGLPRCIIPFVAGNSKLPLRRFILINIVASLIWSIFIVVLGVVFVTYVQVAVRRMGLIVLGLMVVVGVYSVVLRKDEPDTLKGSDILPSNNDDLYSQKE